MSPLQQLSSFMLQLTRTNLWISVAQLNLTKTLVSALAVVLVAICIHQSRRRLRTPRLRGPCSQTFLSSITKKFFPSTPDLGVDWERTYEPAYEIPSSWGSRHFVLSDPTAIAHVFSKDTTTYHKPQMARAVSRPLFGELITVVEGDTHKRQRRVLSSAFSISAIRNLTPVFLECANKLKAEWNSFLESSDSSTNTVTIDVQKWMNHVALDSVGKAGFSHDFGALRGETSSVMIALNSLSEFKPSLPIKLALLLGPLFLNLFAKLLYKSHEQLSEIAVGMKAMATEVLSKAIKEGNDAHQSILGVIIKAESTMSEIRLSTDEIIPQIAMFMTAGYETMAVTLTWALIELARSPEIQETLRAELRGLISCSEDVTYDQLVNNLPYFDAFICELLRLHPALPQTNRMVNEDDTIPLMDPIRTASGTLIDRLFVSKGTNIDIPLARVNTSEALWGPNAGKFDPGRWLGPEDEKNGKKEKVKGYRHLLTFAFGPRMCPGRNYAVAELKAIISVLVHNFTFEFPNGPSTELGNHFQRPKVVGEEGPKVPLLVRKATI